MPLYIKDPEVDALAGRLAAEMSSATKTDAVKIALRHELERVLAAKNFDQRNAGVMAMADGLGANDPHFDQKTFFDEMWD